MLSACRTSPLRQALQTLGLALDSDLHEVHHREFNHTWSVMAGLVDWIPNLLARFFYDRRNARVTWGIIAVLTLAPWYVAFVHCVVRGRAPREKPLLALFQRRCRAVLPGDV